MLSFPVIDSRNIYSNIFSYLCIAKTISCPSFDQLDVFRRKPLFPARSWPLLSPLFALLRYAQSPPSRQNKSSGQLTAACFYLKLSIHQPALVLFLSTFLLYLRKNFIYFAVTSLSAFSNSPLGILCHSCIDLFGNSFSNSFLTVW